MHHTVSIICILINISAYMLFIPIDQIPYNLTQVYQKEKLSLCKYWFIVCLAGKVRRKMKH
jgi:hypothetical protein